VLFSCWAGANMLGLVISDSFKAVVTIYILIPFLVIPQIILSGIMVKFEKLNPNLSSPVAIPIYGEFITARWGYEALAVKQFVDNKYETQFYKYDKALSIAKFKKDYWHAQVRGKIESVKTDLEKGTRSDDFNKKLLLARNEIAKQSLLTPGMAFSAVDSLTPEKVNIDVVNHALNYVDYVRKTYINYSNTAKDLKDALVSKLKEENSDAFLKLRDDYSNESLTDFVENNNETVKLIEYNGEIIQKLDPIFMDPKGKMIRAHFYAPVKNIFGAPLSTFTVNIIVLWVMTLLLYAALYFRVLKKILDSSEVAMGRKFKGSE
jgi:ABC transport system ATP-binding/permease protein